MLLGIHFSWICNTTAIIGYLKKLVLTFTLAPWKYPQHNFCNNHRMPHSVLKLLGIHFSWICNTTAIIRISFKVEVASTAAPWKDPHHNINNDHRMPHSVQYIEVVGLHLS
jgi:hypothetical protein